MGEGRSLGLTEGCTKETIRMIKNMVTELSTGPMAGNMPVLGSKESSTEEDSTTWLMARRKLDSGLKEKESSGFNKSNDQLIL